MKNRLSRGAERAAREDNGPSSGLKTSSPRTGRVWFLEKVRYFRLFRPFVPNKIKALAPCGFGKFSEPDQRART